LARLETEDLIRRDCDRKNRHDTPPKIDLLETEDLIRRDCDIASTSSSVAISVVLETEDLIRRDCDLFGQVITAGRLSWKQKT